MPAPRRKELGFFVVGEFSSRKEKNRGIQQLRVRMNSIKKAVSPLLIDDARQAYWTEWEYNVERAAWAVESDKKAYYGLRTAALISSITVPSLIGLNLAGTGGTVVRWLTFAFGLVTAITTAMLTLYRLSDRWLMYRTLNDDLLKIGWTLVEGLGADPDGAWKSFTTATDRTMSTYNNTYKHAVIQTATTGSGDQGHNDEEGHSKSGEA
jgi:hypothetical protein